MKDTRLEIVNVGTAVLDYRTINTSGRVLKHFKVVCLGLSSQAYSTLYKAYVQDKCQFKFWNGNELLADFTGFIETINQNEVLICPSGAPAFLSEDF
jgi:hypothetical protein